LAGRQTERDAAANGGEPRQAARSFDPRDVEIESLKKERDGLRARERLMRTEAEELHRRFSLLTQASKRFATSMRGRTNERQRYRQRLGTQYAVSRLLNEARDLEEMAPKILEILGERLGGDLGVFWRLDGNALRWETSWCGQGAPPSAFEETCRRSRFERGQGLRGRAWTVGEPVWVEDIVAEKSAVGEAASEAGLRGAFAFPVRDGGVYGVFELFRREALALDEDLLQTVLVVGQLIGHFIERRRAERERDRSLVREREAHHELSAILESINDAFFAVDEEWRFTYVNRKAEEFWSRRRHDLLGKNILEEFPEGAGSEQLRAIQRAKEEGITTSFEAISPVTNVWVAGRAYPSARGVSVFFENVTERKTAEEALKESERRFRTLVSNIPGAVYRGVMSEGHPTMQFLSDRIEEITGYPASDFVADRVRWYGSVIHPEDLPENEATVSRALERGEPYILEYRILHADGTTRWVMERGSGVFTEAGDLLGIDGAIFDVTERREAEEERERFLARELTARAQAEERRRLSRELHDRVAHDMALVHQSLELHEVLKASDPERARTKMDLASKTARAALESTRVLSMELRQQEVRRGLEAALSDLLRDIVPPGVGTYLSVDGDEALVPPETRNQLFLILREAIRNAVSHSGCNRITVRLTIFSGKVEGSVEDDGTGFDAEAVHRADHNGLRSMTERATLSEGTLDLSSEPGGGTTITASIPLREDNGG
jgi:PAS domain S-box-containing protein